MKSTAVLSESFDLEALDELANWRKLGLKTDEIYSSVHAEEDLYHHLSNCTKLSSDNSSRQKINLDELVEIKKAGRLCESCGFSLNLKFVEETGKAADFSVSLMREICKAQNHELKKVNLKNIAKTLLLHADLQGTVLLTKIFTPPGHAQLLKGLELKLEAFEEDLRAFRESPEGLEEIQKYAARRIFETSNKALILADRTTKGGGSSNLSKETKKLRKSLHKSADRLAASSIYSLCYHPNFNKLALELGRNSEKGNPLDNALKYLIAGNWLDQGKHVQVLPYMVSLYLQGQLNCLEMISIHLDEEPSERLIECLLALYPANGSSTLSFKESYEAAKALD